MTIDMDEIDSSLNRLAENNVPEAELRRLYNQLLEKYQGALLQHSEQNEGALAKATPMQNK